MLLFAQLFATPWTAAGQVLPCLPPSHLLESAQIHVLCIVMLSNHLVLCHPFLLLSIFPSIRVFSRKSALLIRWLKCWSFSFSISPSNEYSGLISFRIDWFDCLAIHGTLRSPLQHCHSKALILQCSAFFMVQLLDSYMTTGKTIALPRWTFVSNVSAF